MVACLAGLVSEVDQDENGDHQRNADSAGHDQGSEVDSAELGVVLSRISAELPPLRNQRSVAKQSSKAVSSAHSPHWRHVGRGSGMSMPATKSPRMRRRKKKNSASG